MKKILYTAALGFLALSLFSCDDFLSELPDNRAEIDSEEKVAKILVSAYSEITAGYITELTSDNVVDMGAVNPYQVRWATQVANWEIPTDTANDDADNVWSSYYAAIANANEALEGIVRMGDPESVAPYKGEALVTRAYNHFILVNTFCWHYNEVTSHSDPGIPYMDHTETELDPKYDRGTVAQVYEKIEKDLLEGLPMIEDAAYTVPKYHMNRNAALAFAMRFYLYKGEWEKVVEYGNRLFGGTPQALMRDWKSIGELDRDYDVTGYAYMDAGEKANFLLKTAYTLQYYPANRSYQSRFTHASYLADEETILARGPWGNSSATDYYVIPHSYRGNNHDITLFPKNPYLFEFTDPVARIGYIRGVTIEFCGDLAILDRAEAHAMMGNYELAVADMNLWLSQIFKTSKSVSVSGINSFFGPMDYYTPEQRTVKHRLRPIFNEDIAGDRENIIHAVLMMRRIQTLQEGWRLYDLKRYGMDIYRIRLNEGEMESYDVLPFNDWRRVIQLPQDVIAAGMTANKRDTRSDLPYSE